MLATEKVCWCIVIVIWINEEALQESTSRQNSSGNFQSCQEHRQWRTQCEQRIRCWDIPSTWSWMDPPTTLLLHTHCSWNDEMLFLEWHWRNDENLIEIPRKDWVWQHVSINHWVRVGHGGQIPNKTNSRMFLTDNYGSLGGEKLEQICCLLQVC